MLGLNLAGGARCCLWHVLHTCSARAACWLGVVAGACWVSHGGDHNDTSSLTLHHPSSKLCRNWMRYLHMMIILTLHHPSSKPCHTWIRYLCMVIILTLHHPSSKRCRNWISYLCMVIITATLEASSPITLPPNSAITGSKHIKSWKRTLFIITKQNVFFHDIYSSF